MAQDLQRAEDRRSAVAYYYAGQAIVACLSGLSPVAVVLDQPDFMHGTLTFGDPTNAGEVALPSEATLDLMKIRCAGLRARAIFWQQIALTDQPIGTAHEGDYAALQRLASALHPSSSTAGYKAMLDTDQEVRHLLEIRCFTWLIAVAGHLVAEKSIDDKDLARLGPTTLR